MDIILPELNTDTLIDGGTTADAQRIFILANGALLGEVGVKFPHEKTRVLAERVAKILALEYGMDLRRDAGRALTEVIKVGQGQQKQRNARNSFRTSGRKSTAAKMKSTASTSPYSEVSAAPPPIPTPSLPSETEAKLASIPISPPLQPRPSLRTYINDRFTDGHPLKYTLKRFAQDAEIAELKRLLAKVPGNWRSEEIPDDCRAALEWVDAQRYRS